MSPPSARNDFTSFSISFSGFSRISSISCCVTPTQHTENTLHHRRYYYQRLEQSQISFLTSRQHLNIERRQTENLNNSRGLNLSLSLPLLVISVSMMSSEGISSHKSYGMLPSVLIARTSAPLHTAFTNLLHMEYHSVYIYISV